MIHRFGECELDTDRYELRVKGEPQTLEPQVFRLLAVLIENGNRVVTRDELMDTVWNGRIVSDSTLASRIKSARQAIGDSGERQAFIQTVHGHGYRFVGSSTADSPVAEARLATRLVAHFNPIRSVSAFGTPRLHWFAVLLLLVVVSIGLGVWRFLPSNRPAGSPAKTSIAVLPFADLSEAGDQEYFTDGIAEELRSALARVKNLRVTGRTSSFSFKGKNTDVRTVGERLKVAAVLEGSVRRSQDRVRITIQLVDTSSGYQLWSETYNRQMQDIFAIQDDIARAVVRRLNIGLRNEDAERPLVAQETGSLEAYRLYLQGRHMWKRRSGDSVPNAIKLFKEAIARDADFARAHSALAASYSVLPVYTKANLAESYEAAERTARIALRLAPELSEPYAILGRIYSKRSQWRRAERQFRRAVAMESVDPITHLWYGVHSMSVGRLQQALAQYEHALSLDPAWGFAVCLHSEALYALGQREAAIQGAKRAVALDYVYCQLLLRNMAYATGDFDQAIHHYVDLQRLKGASEDKLRNSRRIYAMSVGMVGTRSAFLQETDQLLQAGKLSSYAAFHRFYHAKQVDRAMTLFDAKAQPKFIRWLRKMWSSYGRPFRTHPDFALIAANLNLIPYWREFGWPDLCGPDPVHGVRCH